MTLSIGIWIGNHWYNIAGDLIASIRLLIFGLGKSTRNSKWYGGSNPLRGSLI